MLFNNSLCTFYRRIIIVSKIMNEKNICSPDIVPSHESISDMKENNCCVLHSNKPHNEKHKVDYTKDEVKCHYCANTMGKPAKVRCKCPGCSLAYCSVCLVKRYRYCKKVADKLPTRTWRCPKCLEKCPCEK